MSEVQVYALSLQNINSSEVEGFEKSLSESIQNKINTYRFGQDRLRSLISHLLVHHLLQLKTGKPIPRLEFIYSDNGKPKVESTPSVHFNVSHSGHWVVCVLDTDEIGVDIEEVQNLDLTDVQGALTTKETRLIEATSNEKKASLFSRIWTAKESFLKAIGEGIAGSLKLDEINVQFEKDRIHLLINDIEMKEWTLKALPLDDNFSLTVCTKRSKNIKNEVTIINIKDIIVGTSNSKY